MKTTKEYIHMITWHRKFLDSQEEITRESLDWRFYDRYLKGKSGRIRTLTDGSGIEMMEHMKRGKNQLLEGIFIFRLM